VYISRYRVRQGNAEIKIVFFGIDFTQICSIAMHRRQGASGCVRVRQGASGCVRVRQGASGCVRVRQGASGKRRNKKNVFYGINFTQICSTAMHIKLQRTALQCFKS
jgi:hypothetical protein